MARQPGVVLAAGLLVFAHGVGAASKIVSAHDAASSESASAEIETWRGEVRATETAFAKTMADRDLDGFAGFIAADAVFVGQKGPLRGREAIVEGWRGFYDGPQAPFSWTPEIVEVVPSAGVALSRGPVFDPAGKRIGTYISTWQRQPDGRWLIVLDSGCPACPE